VTYRGDTFTEGGLFSDWFLKNSSSLSFDIKGRKIVVPIWELSTIVRLL
jgi:hypothetical protein